MATTVTELNQAAVTKPLLPNRWTLNVASDDASTSREIKSAETNKKHWIEQIVVTAVTANADTDWWLLLDGTTPLIGHILTAKGIPWAFRFRPPISGSENTALNIQTASDFGIHYLIEGYTDAYPLFAYDPTPANAATGIGVDSDLSWDSAPWITSHDVYLGTTEAAVLIADTGSDEYKTTTAGKTYDPGTMSVGTTYYWRIDADQTQGDIWSFTTVA